MGVDIKVIERDIGIGLDEIISEVKGLAGHGVKVGIMDGSYPDGTAVASVAYWNEYGTSKMPARPFTKQCFEVHGKDIDKVAGTLIGGIYAGQWSANGAIEELGTWYKGLQQEVMRDGNYAPNSPATLKLKNGSKPLIDTGRLLQSVKWEKI